MTTKTEYLEATRSHTSNRKKYRVYLVQDNEGYWVHCPGGGDVDLGPIEFYTAAVQAMQLHPNADIIGSTSGVRASIQE